jgi:hypothetical protein
MSVSRSFSIAKTLPTNVVTFNTLCYDDNIINDYVPIPFRVTNGVLDINIQDNVTVDLLTPGTFDNDFENQSDLQGSIMGGLKPVSSLGPNMLTFLKNFIADYEDNVSDYNLVTNIEIYNAPTMTKMRYNYLGSDNAYQFDDKAPVKTTPDPVRGTSANNYRVVYIFKSPLVVSYKYDGSATKYLTFTSAVDSA